MEPVVAAPERRRGRKRKRNDVQSVTVDCDGQKKVVETRSLKLVGRYVRKEFQGSGVFLGKITFYNSGLYRINYEDGDSEDLESGEVRAFMLEDGDLTGEWSERKKKLDELLLSKDAKGKFCKDESSLHPANVSLVDTSLSSNMSNAVAGAGEVVDVHNGSSGNADIDSSSDSCEDTPLPMEGPLAPPPELPPSSGHIGVPEEYVSHLFSVHSFLRSFSVPLFLYPFGLDDFVGALNYSVANTLLDSVHVALLRFLKRHFERLSSDGSELALKCLRWLDWSLLDALTWPVFLVHYLVVMGHTNRPDWKGFNTHSLEKDYYTLSAGKKLVVLQVLCDDAMDSEELRAEMDTREESEVGIDIDACSLVMPTGEPTRVHPRCSKTSACKDREALQSVPGHHVLKSSLGSHSTEVSAPVGSSVDEDGNGDECRICGMDGLLLCCDGCPSSYHSRCLGLNKMYMPEGSWYCPECKINAAEPKILQGTTLRGGYNFGVDPYGQVFVATCDHLLVLNASLNSENCLRYYNRSDILSVIHCLYSRQEHAITYSEICRGIMLYWELPEDILPCNGTSEFELHLENEKGIGESTGKLVNLLDKSSQVMTEVDRTGSCVTGISAPGMAYKNCDEEPVQSVNSLDTATRTGQLGNTDSIGRQSHFIMNTMLTEPTSVGGLMGQPADRCELSQHCTSSVTDAVSYTTKSINFNYTGPVNTTPQEVNTSVPCLKLKIRIDKKAYGSATDGCLYMGSSFKTTGYINYYLHGDFAASAAANLAILSSEEQQVPDSHSSYNRRKVMSANVSFQVKAFSSAAVRFFWPNTEKKLVEGTRERCTWCFSCKAPVSSRRGCLLNAAASNAIRGAIKLLAGVRPMKNGDDRLAAIATYIMFMEESLSGLLVGPFLNDNFRKRWRKQVEQATSRSAIKILLLELEENVRTIAFSVDWVKLVDGGSTQSSTSQIAASAAGSTQKRRPGRRGRKPAAVVDVSPDNSEDTSTDFTWWRGGKLSKLMFQRGILPCSMIRQAARQGGSKKIPGIHYVEGHEIPKSSRQLIWRSAVEMSRNTAQLALQVRYLDSHVRWGDLVRPDQIPPDGKGPEAEASAFRNAFICDKKVMEQDIRYCIAFGSQKHLPSRVMKNIVEVEQALDDGKERYWFSETRIPLYLIKEYEKKLVKDKPADVLSALQRQQMASCKNIFSYLWRKQDNTVKANCCSCHQEVLHRTAAKCSSCQGFCHEYCATSSTVHINDEVEFFSTCKKCCETQAVTQTQTSSGSPTSPLLIQGRDYPNAATANKLVKLVVKGPATSVGKMEYSSQVKLTSSSAAAKKSKNKNKGLIWKKKNCEDTGIDFRLKNILLKGNPDMNFSKPVCRLCDQPYSADLMYIRCETCQFWYHADAVGLEESQIFSLLGFKCSKCRRIKSPDCPYDPKERKKKMHSEQASKLESREIDSDSYVVLEHPKEARPAFSSTSTWEEADVATNDPLLSVTEFGTLQNGYGCDNLAVSQPGPQKLQVRRHNRLEKDIHCHPPDPFLVEIAAPFEANASNSAEKLPVRKSANRDNNLDYYSATNSSEVGLSKLPGKNAENFEDDMMLDYDDLGFDDMEFEPQTYFSFNELLASDDGGGANGNEAQENCVENWDSLDVLPVDDTLEISYDEEEPFISVGTTIEIVPCKICSRTEPCPDLCCKTCGIWIHNHCSPWVESKSWEDEWKCGHCREWR